MAPYGNDYRPRFGFRDNPDSLRRLASGRGYSGGDTRRYGADLYRNAGGRSPRPDRRPDWESLTGMESNVDRGVYGSGYRVDRPRTWPGHGGYWGGPGNYGGGMNPGRRGGR